MFFVSKCCINEILFVTLRPNFMFYRTMKHLLINKYSYRMKKHLLMLCAAVIAATMSLEARVILIDEGFENGIQNSVWTQEFDGAQMPWSVEDIDDGLSFPSTVVQGTKRAFLRNPSNETIGYTTRLVSKVMDLNPVDVPDPELIFFYANPRWGGDRDTLRVLYRTATSGADSKWKQLAEYSSASSDWQKVKIKLPDVGHVYQIAFEGKDNLGHGIVLDSIKLQSAAQCRIPDHLSVANKGAGVVRLSWAGSYDVDEYELVITQDTIDPDMITEIEASEPGRIVFHDLVGDSRHYELKLEPGESYLAYVRSICDDGEEISSWSSEVSKDGPFGFHVRPTLQVPFTENFNTVVNPDDPTRLLDWTWKSNTGNPNPYINTKTSNATVRAYYSHDKSYAVIFSGGSTSSPSTFIPADRYAYLATPALADTTNENFSLSQCQVHFWATVYTATGRQYGSGIIIGVMDDPDDIMTFVPVDTVRVWGNKTHEEYIIDLSSYKGTGNFLAFVSQFDRDNLFYLDDVTVEYRKAQNKVTEIIVNPRDTFATITWNGNASSYNVLITNAEVDPSNPSANAVVDQAVVQGNSYFCDVLEANHNWNSPYHVYVQASGQEWSNGKRFVTLVSKRDIPFSYDFEAKNTNIFNLPSDNSNYIVGMGIFGNSGTYPAVVNNSSNSYAGSGYLYMNKRGGTDAWIVLPMVDNLDSVQVKFYLSGGSTYDQAHATVGVMSNPMEISTFVPVSSFKLNNTGYTRCYANFEHYSGPEGVIAIIWDDVKNMTENTINYIDELTVDSLADCVPPTNIELEIFPDSITTRWELSSHSDTWELFISRAAIPAKDRIHKTLEELSAMSSVVVADSITWTGSGTPTFGFGGLTPHMKYYLYVRATCDMEWWSEMSFSTPCKPEEYPYKETFEAFTVGTTAVGCWQTADYMGVGYPRIAQAGTSSASNKVLELYSYGTTHRSMAILPEIEGSLSSMLLSFDVRAISSSYSSSRVIVGTMGDIEDESTFVPFDTIMVSGSSAFQKVRLILSNYHLAHENIAITSGLGATVTTSDVYIDNVELKDPSCIEPYDIKQTSIAPDMFDIEWKGAAPNDRWELKVLNTSVSVISIKNGTYNTSYDVVHDTIVVGKSFHLEGLQAKSTYYVYIHTLCGDSAWASATVHTSCDYLNPNKPNKETFESYSDGEVPECWTVGNRTGSGTMPSVSTLNSTKVFSIKQSTSTCPSWIASPVIKCDSLSTMLVTFDVSTYNGETCVFGVMTDPTDLSSFVALDSVNGTGSSNIMQKSYDLSVYANRIPASARYIAWRGKYNDDDYIYLDNISIISMACPMPKPSIESLTKESVQIGSGLRSGDPWILLITNRQVSADDLANEDYVVPESWIVTRDTVTRRSKEIFGLEGQTKYYVATASFCEDSIVSMWKTLSFMTPCVAMTPEQLGTITFSSEQGFEVGVEQDLPCWVVGNKSQGASSENIPYVDNTYKHNDNNCLKMHDEVSSSSAVVGAYAIMPELDVDSISKYQVSFYARGYNSSTAESKLIVGVISDPTDLMTFEAIDTLNLSKTAWDPFSVGFETYLGDYMGDWGKNIMFLSDFGASNYAYISEVTVELIPRCRPVGTFSVDSVGEDAAVISFKGYQDSFRLLLANRALKESEKTTYMYLLDTIVDHSDNIRLTGLESAANYYVYAQGICEDGDSTAISMTYAYIHTECPTEGGAALPFYDDFESYATGEKQPGCWQLLGSSYLKIGEISSNGSKGINLWSSGYIVVPRVNGNLENLKLSFDARSYYSSSSSKFYVGVMGDVNDLTTFQLLETFDLAASEKFTNCTMELGNYDLLYDNLVLTAGITNVTPEVKDDWIDNVSLELASTCNSPKLKSESVSYNTAVISLTPAFRTDTLWEIALLPDSIYQRISNIALYLDTSSLKREVRSTTIALSDLTPATSYDIVARTICSPTEKSNWTRSPLRITTQFYYQDSYFFGFETSEKWHRSTGSASDSYYLHPALVAGRDSIGARTQSYMYYPYSLENTTAEKYARTGDGALRMFCNADYFGEYLIFPAIDEPKARSFEFKIRPGSIVADSEGKLYPKDSYNGILEIGTIAKGTDFSTYRPMVTIRLDKVTSRATSRNNYLFSSYTLDLDSATLADRQIVFHQPQQPMDTSNLFIDDVRLDAAKGYSLVALNKVVAEGNQALVEWQNIGGPWNLTIKTASGTVVQTFPGLTATSQLVENLEPQTDYIALLEAANKPSGSSSYVLSDKLSFRTLCQTVVPNDMAGGFIWNFDDPYSREVNDILAGEAADSLYYKPACFHVGITYSKPVNGYQWLIQRKGYDPTGNFSAYSATRHQEVGRNDSHSLRIHTTDANYNSYLVFPELDCRFDTMMIEFYARCFVNYDASYSTASYRGKIVDASYLSSNYSQSVVLGTLTDPSDFGTLQVIDTLRYSHTDLTSTTYVTEDPSGLRYWEKKQLPLTNAQGKYLVLFQPAPGLMYIDDLSVKAIGNTMFAPLNTQTTNITATSATLSWRVYQPQYESVVVVLNASGTREVLRDTILGTQYDLTNLQGASAYQWYVYQTHDNNDSPASSPLGFATECVVIGPDYTCSFEPEEGTKTIDGQLANYKQTLCWTYSDAAQGEWRYGTYDPYNQQKSGDYNYSFAGSSAVVMRALYSAYGTSYQPYIAMPEMDVTAYDTLQVSFMLRPAYVSAETGAVATSYTGSSYSKSIIVGTMTDPNNAATFMPLDTVTYEGTLSSSDIATEANNYLFQQMQVELVGATGPYVAFMTSFYEKGGTSLKMNDYIWLDEVRFERKNECKEPINLTALQVATEHAVLSWNAIDSANGYWLQVSTDPNFADEDAFIFNEKVSENTVRVEHLRPQTTYVWRVRALCGDKWGESAFTSRESFKTVRSPYFYEDFSTAVSATEWTFSKVHADVVVDSTGSVTRATTDNWSFNRTTTNYGLAGPHYAASGYSGDYHWMVTPEFYLPADDSVHFSMDLALTACNAAHALTGNAVTESDMKDDYYFMIIVSEDGGKTWKSENILAKWQNTNPSGTQLRDIPATGMQVRYSLAKYADKNIKIGFYREAKSSSTTGIAIHLDNVRLAYFDKTIDYTSACQYEDVNLGDIHLSGDDTQPGIHSYPTCFYVSDAEALAGKKDSVFALEIEIFPAQETTIADTICEGDTYTALDFQPKTVSGVYRRKLQAIEHGCDSIVTLYLEVTPRRYGEDTKATICKGGEPFEWHGNYYNRAGVYRDTLVSSLGCDSIETLIVSYVSNVGEDTIYRHSTVAIQDLPFTYEDINYAAGQAPIYYPEGTPKGEYADTVRVLVETCTATLVHTLTIYDRDEAIDHVDEEEDGARKVIYQDHMYIILNDEWYNAAGQKVANPMK